MVLPSVIEPILFFSSLQILDHWSPKLSHENDGLVFNPADEVKKEMTKLTIQTILELEGGLLLGH